ncbi:hypothetical protein TNCV_2738571 [Trichonephila clavipes]|nr:hypothetical protein TNCV_2738571 [Trichonephila clavipes]
MLSKPTSGPSYCPTRPVSSSPFHKPLPYKNFSQITETYGSSIVITEFSQSTASFSEKLNPISTLKTTCGNRGRHKNVARELTSADGL